MQLLRDLKNAYCTKKRKGSEVIRRQLQALFPPDFDAGSNFSMFI
jgi:hypothetical protein